MRIISTKKLMILSMLLILSGSIFGQATLHGLVTDSLSHEALVGASVVLSGTSQGSATNMDGEYKIPNIAEGTYKIKVSYVGYETKIISFPFKGNQSAELFIELTTKRVEGKTITVTAQAQGQMSAINEQLSSDKIVNVVSAEKMKELPDANIAESIGRLPGVSLGRTNGEADKVIVRGLSPQYNKVTIEGIPMVSTSGSRANGNNNGNGGSANYSDRSIDLSMISDDLVKGVEVSKSLRADMDADALGGTINMTLKEAPMGLKYDILANGGYNALSTSWRNYKLSGSISDRFFNDLIGVRLQLNGEEKQLPSQNFNGGYDGVSTTSSKDANGNVVVGYIKNTSSANLQVDNLLRKRYGGSLILDYESDFVDVKFLNTYNQKKDHDEQYTTTYQFNANNMGQFTKSYSMSDFNTEERTHSLQTKFKFWGTELNASVSYTKGNYSNPGFDFPFEQVSTPNPFKPSQYIFANPATLIKSAGLDNPKNFILLNLDATNNFLNDNDYDVKVDYNIPFKYSDDLSGKFSVGGKFHELDRDNQGVSYYYNMEWGGMAQHQAAFQSWLMTHGVPNAKLGDQVSGIGGSSGLNFMDPNYTPPKFLNGQYTLDNWGYDMGFLYNVGKEHYADQAPQYWTDGPQTFNSIYKAAEKLAAGYAMAEINIGTKLSVVPGIRYEEMRTTYGAYVIYTNNSNANGLAGQAPVWRSINTNNFYYFPSVNAKYKATDNIQLMGAYYMSASRPNFSDMSPLVDYPTVGNINASSNAYLKPAIAQNFDLGASVFSNTLGLFSVNGFYKEIKDLPTSIPGYMPYQRGIIYGGPADLLSRLPGLAYFDSTWLKANNKSATTSAPINNPEKAYIRGIELSWQTHLWYLPGVLSGIVLDLNLSLINSHTFYPYFSNNTIAKDTVWNAAHTRVSKVDYYNAYLTRSGSLLNQPKAIYNAIIGWDYLGFSTRVSFRYQQTTLTSLDSKYSLGDSYYDNVLLVDISAKQKLMGNLSIFVSFTNIGSHIDTYYYNSPNGKLPTSSQTYGFNSQFGLTYSL